MRRRSESWWVAGCLLSIALLLATAAAGEEKSEKPKSPIDLNTATAEELESLPGIGEVIAGRILRHRRISGKFRTVNELLVVRGISRRKLTELRRYVTVGPEAGNGKEAKDAEEKE